MNGFDCLLKIVMQYLSFLKYSKIIACLKAKNN